MPYSGTQKTRLGLSAIPRGLYGSFAGKEASAVVSGPFDVAAGQVLVAGAVAGGLFYHGASAAEAFLPGGTIGDVDQ